MALGRYTLYRGKRPAGDPLPEGVRQDTRKHTRHVLRPTAELVARYLGNPSQETWRDFEREYLGILEKRFADDRQPFDRLVALAKDGDVWLGCSCPTRKNPDVRRCHTFLALRFMQAKYPILHILFPQKDKPTRT